VRASTIVMIGFAVVFGLIAVFVAHVWLNNQASKQAKNLQSKSPAVTMQTIVVAKRPLRFGTELKASMLKEIAWPEQDLPPGAFRKIGDVLSGGRRVVLTAIEANEPVLALKITGPGERATLSALVHKGMKAVTVRVNDVGGVGGFVQPGDRVDVVLTRQVDKGSATSEVILQDARVLAVDQLADERAAKVTVPKSVTLEVTTVEAEKLSLASSVGNLSLLLRKAGETQDHATHRISLQDLFGGGGSADATTTVTVIRPASKQDYSVPVEQPGARSALLGEQQAKR
jgi:pilus assembly protein CpaB